MSQLQSESPPTASDGPMTIKNLIVEDFRGFDRFELKNLGRINLLVGTNNCGKTTVLEAVSILMAKGDASAIWTTLARRGEDLYGDRDTGSLGTRWQVDIRRLFRGHKIEVGRSFQIAADVDHGRIDMFARIEESKPVQPQFFESGPQDIESPEDFLPPLSLSLEWGPRPGPILSVPISRRGGISSDAIRRGSLRPIGIEGFPVHFITAASQSAEEVSSMFEEIVLTPEEDLVTDAMRIIEPRIERIASSGTGKGRPSLRYARGGILVRLEGVEDRIPIGSMGDGIWRVLGLALAVVQSKGGVLLVDEIDTGLHHTVMRETWEFLHQAARKYNVQVIATTHSRDCYQSLAAISRDGVSEGSEVTISRIERGREAAVSYTEQEIVAAAKYGTEVR